MDEVQRLYDAWGNRASVKAPDAIVNGERCFKVGSYSITVPDDPTQPAKVAHIYNRWGASENPMPNMTFNDGEMRIPVEDFADLILRRVPADELAEGLWCNDEVRERFVECMISRYSGEIPDEDRRKVLDGLQKEIYAKAIDRAVERLNSAEEHARVYSHRRRWEGLQMGHYEGLYEKYRNTLYEMREKGLIEDADVTRRLNQHSKPESIKAYFSELADPVAQESVGKHWQESRDYWRARLEEFFPEPERTEHPDTADAVPY